MFGGKRHCVIILVGPGRAVPSAVHVIELQRMWYSCRLHYIHAFYAFVIICVTSVRSLHMLRYKMAHS